jgi:hypothetical protein
MYMQDRRHFFRYVSITTTTTTTMTNSEAYSFALGASSVGNMISLISPAASLR